MKCYTLWTADLWLMRKSFELHGIFSTSEKAAAYAKKHQLKTKSNHIIIDSGTLNDYDSTCERIFTTEREKGKERHQLE